MNIYCCGCTQEVEALLITGRELYPHRPDLFDIPFWRCTTCRNYIGCHHKSSNRLKPLGCIPTPEIRKLRTTIHNMLDPLWKSGAMTRNEVYELISNSLGVRFHTAEIRSVEQAMDVISLLLEVEHEN